MISEYWREHGLCRQEVISTKADVTRFSYSWLHIIASTQDMYIYIDDTLPQVCISPDYDCFAGVCLDQF